MAIVMWDLVEGLLMGISHGKLDLDHWRVILCRKDTENHNYMSQHGAVQIRKMDRLTITPKIM